MSDHINDPLTEDSNTIPRRDHGLADEPASDGAKINARLSLPTRSMTAAECDALPSERL
ncbi:hypothetical protein [Methylobacterium sp. 4-46]|uniref:hypothetical protein n=1 Tax=Methylobacterium sp. (strain 4-46) TaxID=426117 RepID=UPI00143AE43F|nr:hypothetical protein [Methylobacterium sp. 4-46]